MELSLSANWHGRGRYGLTTIHPLLTAALYFAPVGAGAALAHFMFQRPPWLCAAWGFAGVWAAIAAINLVLRLTFRLRRRRRAELPEEPESRPDPEQHAKKFAKKVVGYLIAAIVCFIVAQRAGISFWDAVALAIGALFALLYLWITVMLVLVWPRFWCARRLAKRHLRLVRAGRIDKCFETTLHEELQQQLGLDGFSEFTKRGSNLYTARGLRFYQHQRSQHHVELECIAVGPRGRRRVSLTLYRGERGWRLTGINT